MPVTYSNFAQGVQPEGAFEILAIAKHLISTGKKIYELEIGDSPFPTPAAAREAGIEALNNDHCHYGPSAGIQEFRLAASDYVNREFNLATNYKNIIAGPGAKTFQLLFAETFLNPGDGVLVFTPFFPTYPSHISRRNARMVLSPLQEEHEFRPSAEAVKHFLDTDEAPKAIFLNTPHNPTGGVATKEDLAAIANVIRDSDIVVFSDEPYDQMVWDGTHHSIFAEAGMETQVVAAYTFSKSYSMSGWRLGFAVASEPTIALFDKLTNTVLSCVPPFTQLAGVAALRSSQRERDEMMASFHYKLGAMVDALNSIDGISCLFPGGSFYAFPNVKSVCNQHQITSHGLAMYLLQGANPDVGVACLGGECFGDAGGGFIRLSSSLPKNELLEAIVFMQESIANKTQIASFREKNPEFCLQAPY